MPTPRLLKDYPPEFEAAFRAAVNAPFIINCVNAEEARQQRFHLYAYRTAIRRERLEGKTPQEYEHLRDLKTIASLLSFKIKASAITIYRPRKISNIQQALNNVRDTGTASAGPVADGNPETKPGT